MKPLFATLRTKAIGQSPGQEIGMVDEPTLHEGLRYGHEESSVSDLPRAAEKVERAPYATRLRVIIGLALLSWAIIAFIAWVILRV